MYRKRAFYFILFVSVFFNIKGQSVEVVNDSLMILNGARFLTSVITKISQEKEQIEITENAIFEKIDSLPAFGIYKDNYFITGIPLNTTINNKTADVKFQLSIRHRLTKSKLPLNTFLFFTYTQKSFWNIYETSSPFKDNNYNPGIGLGRYIIKDNKLTGGSFLQLEHESNGRSDLESRSINYLSLIGKYFFNESVFFRMKISIPFLYKKENPDILNYKNINNISVNYKPINDKCWVSAGIGPTKKISTVNITLNGGYRISAKFNQYIFTEFYYGAGDSLLDYKKHFSQIRLGIGIKPDFYSIF